MFISGYLLGRKYTIFMGQMQLNLFYQSSHSYSAIIFPVATNIFVHGISFGQNRIIIYDRIFRNYSASASYALVCFHDHIILLSFPIMSGQRISSVFMIAGCIILVVMAAQGGVWMLIDVLLLFSMLHCRNYSRKIFTKPILKL